MRLYFITAFIAFSLLFHQNHLYAKSGTTDSGGGYQDKNTGEYHYSSGKSNKFSKSNTSSSSTNSSSRTHPTSNTSSSSNQFSTNNTSSSDRSSSDSNFLSNDQDKQSSNKRSSGAAASSSPKSNNPLSGYINIPNLAGSEVVSNIQEKNDGNGKLVKVVEVINGDTFQCMIDKKEVAIKLYGIDAPENGQTFSLKSTNYLKQLLDGKNVIIKIVENDKSGGVIALAYTDKINVNEALVKSGAAWVYPQNCKLIFCKEWNNYQEIAKALKMSLWEEREPVPPWEYRQQ